MKMLYRILKITKTALKIIRRKQKKMNSVSFFVYFCSVKDGLHSDKMSTKKVLEKKAMHDFDKLVPFKNYPEFPC